MTKQNQNKRIETQILTLLGEYPDTRIPIDLLANVLHSNSKKGKRKLSQTLKALAAKGKITVSDGGMVTLPVKCGSGKTISSKSGSSKADAIKSGSPKSGTAQPLSSKTISKKTKEVSTSDKRSSRHSDTTRSSSMSGEYTGVLDVTARGDGYVIVEGLDEDILIPQRAMGTALHSDTVTVVLTGKDRRRGRDVGRITEIIRRSGRLFVGELMKTGEGTYIIEPDQKSAHVDFYVLDADLKGARVGEKVSFRLEEWTHPGALPKATDIRSLGKAGTSEAEILSILSEKQFHAAFPDPVEAFAEEIPEQIPADEMERRVDYREKVTFTIDPLDAKDFDDALSIEVLENGNHLLGVHIADVTHYMPRGSVLDEEAYQRATSVYLVDRVIPMLPERLSNGLCSLRPNEDKLTYSCFMEFTPKGKIVNYSIRETIIHSKQRFVYQEVQEILDGHKDHPFKPDLLLLQKLAETLMNIRFQQGAIQFETPEPRFVLDENGKPLEVIVKERLFAHKLIEECMLAANKTVALHVESLRKTSDAKTEKGSVKAGGRRKSNEPFPFFYRIHDRPDSQKLENVMENVRPLGIQTGDVAKLTSGEINHLLKQVEGTQMERIVNDLILRAMAKAEYSPKNIGHFGLAFSHYAHFTSPIRRYPDVVVHRLLKSYASGRREYNLDELFRAGEHCSSQERSAAEAERDSVKLKQVEFLSTRLGEQFDGVISGVSEHGFYVILNDIYCEGMVRMSELKDDYYVYNPQRHALVARGKKKEFRLGQPVKVQVLRTDNDRRQIDFTMA